VTDGTASGVNEARDRVLVNCCDVQSWDAFFRNVSNDVAPGLAHVTTSTDSDARSAAVQHVSSAAATAAVPSKLIEDHLSLQAITRAYQV